jgi:aryl-alcohol dehydrogenase-like predicted oxidoreductase
MRYGNVLGIPQKLNRVVLGTMIISNREFERSAALLDAALDLGVNVLDTANGYGGGESERGIGQWMEERKVRERVVVLTKGCHPSPDRTRVTEFDMSADIHDSLARLRTSYIDLWMLHRDDESVPVADIVNALERHRRSGRIRAYGGSNWRHERIAAANDYARSQGMQGFSASSPNYGLAEQVQDPWGKGCVTVSGPAQAAAREWYRDNAMPIFAYSSLARGLLSGRISRENLETTLPSLDGASRTAYCHEVNFQRLDRLWQLSRERGASVPQLATAWLMAQPLPVFPLVGAATREELQSTIQGADMTLSAQEEAWLDLRSPAREGRSAVQRST